MTDRPSPGAAPHTQPVGPTLRTERLTLRTPGPGDVDAMFRLHSDPRTYRHAPDRVMHDPAEAESRLAGWLADWERDGVGYFLVHTHAGELVGICGLRLQEGEAPFLNLYYRLLFDAQGSGYAEEAARAVVAWGQSLRPAVPIVAVISPENPGSLRLAAKLGFVPAPERETPGEPDLWFTLAAPSRRHC